MARKPNPKDSLTRADIDAFLKTYKSARGISTSKRTANPLALSTRSLRGDIQYSETPTGQKRYTAGKGVKEHELKDPKTKEYLDSTRRIDAEAAALGKPRKEKKSLFNKTIDVLSRGNFASAEAFKEGFDPKTKAKWEPKEALKGFWSGLQGKEKTTFKDVLTQHGHTGKGMGTLGFALDVVADPLTWTGAGAVVKAGVKSNKAVDILNDLGKVEADHVRKGASIEQFRDATNTVGAPVSAIKKKHVKNLSAEGRAVYDFALDARGANNSASVERVLTQFKRKVGNASHIDLRAFPDDKLRQIAVDTVRAEEKAHPGLTHLLRRVRSTRTTMRHEDLPGKPQAPADASASYERFKQGHIDGTIGMHPDKSGNRDYMSGYSDSGNQISVKLDSPEAAIKYMTAHEVGHIFAQAMPEDVKEALLKTIEGRFGKTSSLTKDEFRAKYLELERKILKAEKNETLEPLTKVQEAALKTGDWKLFSKKRGYTDEDIANYEEWLKLTDHGVDFSKIPMMPVPYPKGSPNFGGEATSVADLDKFYDELVKLGKTPSTSSKSYANELSEYGTKNVEEMTAEAWAEFRLMGDKARPLAKAVAEEMIKNAPKAPSMADTDAILKELADDFIMSDVKNIDEWATAQIEKKYGDVTSSNIDELDALVDGKLAERGLSDIKAVKAATHEQLLAITARNINPAVKKQFALKIGPTAVGIPKSAEAVEKVQKALTSIPGIKQSVDKFNELFRATAHIPPELNHLRAQQQGLGIALVTQHLKSLEYAFGQLKKADRVGLLKAIRDGATEGNITKGGVDLYGQPIPDMVKYITDQIEQLDIGRMGAGIEADELNAFLGGKFAIRESGRKTRTKIVKYTDAQGRKATKKVTENTSELTADLIQRAILNNPAIDDPAQALYLYTAAMNQAIAKRDLWTTIANTHGVPVGDLGKQLASKHGWVEVDKIKGAEGFLFPPEVAEGMRKIQTVFNDRRTTGQFIDQYDRALQTFKGVVTRYNPSFHPRTFMGEMLLGYMGGMKNLPRSYTKAGIVIKGRNKEFIVGPNETPERFAQADKGLMQASNVLRTDGRPAGAMNSGADGSKTVIQRKFGKDTQTLTADKIWHLYLESGLKSGFASTDLVKRTASPMLSGAMAKPGAVAQAVTEGVEDYGRLAHFIDVIQHSKARTLEEAVEEATRTVRKFHLDYTAVTGFERNVMTRAIPFYKWIRLSTPLMAEILLTQPGKALLIPKAMRDFSEMAGYDPDEFGPFPGGADAVVPEWLRDQGAVPWMEYKGNTNYFNPTALFPLAGSVDVAEGGGFKALSPFFKWGSDIYHGEDKFQNQLRGEASSNKDRLHYAAAQTPQTNFLEQIITKRDPGIPREQSVVQFLANLGNQPNTEKRMRGEAFRQQKHAGSNRKAAKEEAEKRQGFLK